MSFSEPTLVQKLSTQLRYLTQRQTLLAQNIANVDTPGYQAQDLKKVDFNDMATAEAGKLAMRTTSAKHLAPTHSGITFGFGRDQSDFEKKPMGNNVGLEEQMGKLSDVGAQNQLTTTLLHKFHQLYRVAVDNRGGA